MSERAPDQENAPASNAVEIFARGEQLALIPEIEAAPTMPKAGTLADRLLAMFARGEELTHPDFEARTGSWRLAAVVFELCLLGWRIESTRIGSPALDLSDRRISRYWLAASHVRFTRAEH
jgi:hypothetical protein